MSLSETGCNGTVTNSRGISGGLVPLRLPDHQKGTARDSGKATEKVKRAKQNPKAAAKREAPKALLTASQWVTAARNRHLKRMSVNSISKESAKVENHAPGCIIPHVVFTGLQRDVARERTACFPTNSPPPRRRRLARQIQTQAEEPPREDDLRKDVRDQSQDPPRQVFALFATQLTAKQTWQNMSHLDQKLSSVTVFKRVLTWSHINTFQGRTTTNTASGDAAENQSPQRKRPSEALQNLQEW